MTYTSQEDMFAVMYKFKDHIQWTYVNSSIRVNETEIELHDYTPKLYLNSSLKEAKSIYIHVLSLNSKNNNLKCIKISKMNKYNLEKEFEVLDGYYKEF